MDYMARLRCKYFVAKWKDNKKHIQMGEKLCIPFLICTF